MVLQVGQSLTGIRSLFDRTHRSLHSVTTFSNTISASPNLAVSTSVPELALVNSATGTLVRQSPSPSLITHLVSSHTLLISGSSDGCIRTHDVRIGRSGSNSESSVKAHTKGVQGLEVNGNNIFTIGWSVRSVPPSCAWNYCLTVYTGSLVPFPIQ